VCPAGPLNFVLHFLKDGRELLNWPQGLSMDELVYLCVSRHVQEESWPEIARRQFLLLEVAAMVKALDSSGGLGPAVGAPGEFP
jgi:hypothetical protein